MVQGAERSCGVPNAGWRVGVPDIYMAIPTAGVNGAAILPLVDEIPALGLALSDTVAIRSRGTVSGAFVNKIKARPTAFF